MIGKFKSGEHVVVLDTVKDRGNGAEICAGHKGVVHASNTRFSSLYICIPGYKDGRMCS